MEKMYGRNFFIILLAAILTITIFLVIVGVVSFFSVG